MLVGDRSCNENELPHAGLISVTAADLDLYGIGPQLDATFVGLDLDVLFYFRRRLTVFPVVLYGLLNIRTEFFLQLSR